MFKGKGINFLRGYKGEGMLASRDINISPELCSINFAVPSDPVLKAASKQYTGDAKNPGFLNHSLDAFSKAHHNKDVKISIDGKKLASGFGKRLGEEDLCGFETKPTLSDRRLRFEEEKSKLEAAKSSPDH